MTPSQRGTLAHEAGHALALHHYFGAIMAEVELAPEPQVHFFPPLAKSTDWRDALGMAVVAVAGVTAAEIITGNDYPLRVDSTDAAHLEDAYQHLQTHWTLPRVNLPTPQAFIRAAYLEAENLIHTHHAELKHLMHTINTTGDLPAEYLEPNYKNLKSELQRLKGELAREEARQGTTPRPGTKARSNHETKDLVSGFTRPNPATAYQHGYALSMRLSGPYLHRSGALEGGGGLA
ncbi:MAG: hypothetical protein H3C58_12045 [Fimbriimonadaceae bacterium]|nr:hypothetical protein [Fimbriimonadaceae bacterium]